MPQKKKMGRPTDSPKIITMKIRFDKDTFEQLENAAKEWMYPERKSSGGVFGRCITVLKKNERKRRRYWQVSTPLPPYVNFLLNGRPMAAPTLGLKHAARFPEPP